MEKESKNIDLRRKKVSLAEAILRRIPPGEEKLRAIAEGKEAPASICDSRNIDQEILEMVSHLARRAILEISKKSLKIQGSKGQLNTQQREWLEKVINEEQAINDWFDCKPEQNPPTTGDSEILTVFPSEYLKNIKLTHSTLPCLIEQPEYTEVIQKIIDRLKKETFPNDYNVKTPSKKQVTRWIEAFKPENGLAVYDHEGKRRAIRLNNYYFPKLMDKYRLYATKKEA